MCRPSVYMCIVVLQAKIGDGVARSYIVTVDRAWGLAKADRFGKADPFISVKVPNSRIPCAKNQVVYLHGSPGDLNRNTSEDTALSCA